MLPLGKHRLGIGNRRITGQQRLTIPPFPQQERRESEGKRHLAATFRPRKHKGMRDALLIDELTEALFSLFLTYDFVEIQRDLLIRFSSECRACC